MKRIILLIALNLVGLTTTLACTVCKKQQPELLQGITHGAGPESDWDYLIVGIMVVFVAGTLLLSAWLLAKPGESQQAHIKYSIFKP